MNTLIICPTYRLEPETVNSIFRLRPVGGMDIVFTRDNPHDTPEENVAHNYCKAQRMALDGDYDALLTVESDNIIPADTLERLYAVDADVAMGLYLFRHGNPLLNAFVSNKPDDLGNSLSHFPQRLAEAWKQGIIEVTGAGFGCTLIHRHVLEAIPFRHESGAYSDWHFAKDCQRAGYITKMDFGVRCGHKRPEDGLIFWPTPDDKFLASQGLLLDGWHMAEARQ